MSRTDQHHRRAASVILWLAPLFICAPSLQSQSASLPPGPFEAKVRTACTECHEARIKEANCVAIDHSSFDVPFSLLDDGD